MITFKSFIATHIQYNTWANLQFAGWLKSLISAYSENLSVIGIIQHLAKAQEFWNRFLKNEFIGDYIWQTKIENPINEIILFEKRTTELEDTCLAFSEEELLEKVHFKTPWAESQLQRMYYILHFVNHNTHHRGQITTMVRQLGFKGNIPDTEYSIYVGNKNG